jgi:hypothetical protein
VCHTPNHSCVRTSGYFQQWSASCITVTQFTNNCYNLLNGHEPIDTLTISMLDYRFLDVLIFIKEIPALEEPNRSTPPSWNTATRSHAGHVQSISHRHNLHNNCLCAKSLSQKKKKNFYPHYDVQEFVLISLRVDTFQAVWNIPEIISTRQNTVCCHRMHLQLAMCDISTAYP